MRDPKEALVPEAPVWSTNAIDDGRCGDPACVAARTKLRELVWRAEQVREALAAGPAAPLDREALLAWLDTRDARALFERPDAKHGST